MSKLAWVITDLGYLYCAECAEDIGVTADREIMEGDSSFGHRSSQAKGPRACSETKSELERKIMSWFLIQVSNHPEAGRRIATETGSKSWQTVYEGATTAKEARRAVDDLSAWFKHARCFKGRDIGKLHYAVLRQ